MAAAIFAAKRNQGPSETRDEARIRRKAERQRAEELLLKEENEAKEALAYAKKKESDAAKEEQEAIDAEAQAEKEQQEADEARLALKKKEEDVLRVEAKVLTLEKRLAEGDDVHDQLDSRRAELVKEQKEVDAARAKADQEYKEAGEAKATAMREKAEALEARAKAAAAAQISFEELKQAEEAAMKLVENNWVQHRGEAHEPLIEEDLLYRVIFLPAKLKLEKDRDETISKIGKRKIQNLIHAMHRQCEHMQEDMDFLMECFNFLDENEDQLLDVDELKIWLTVLNHGQEPSQEDIDQCMETLDEYREMLGADGTEGVLENSDFLLVTFDYYLALGKMYMRALFTDLILS